MTATFVPNPIGIAALEHSPGVENAMEDAAAGVAELAKSYAPVDTGAYRDGIVVEGEGEGAKVVATVDYSIYIEYGTLDTPEFGTLRRAAESYRR